MKTIQTATFVVGVLLIVGCSREPLALRQYEGPPVAAPLSIRDLDEIVFVCNRSLHDVRTVRFTRVRERNVVLMQASIVSRLPELSQSKPSEEVPAETFAELEDQLLRSDLFDRSLLGSPSSADGSVWELSGRKAELTITHRRLNAPDVDPAMVSIGMRILRMAGIELPENKVY